jgi:hypothetical protein
MKIKQMTTKDILNLWQDELLDCRIVKGEILIDIKPLAELVEALWRVRTAKKDDYVPFKNVVGRKQKYTANKCPLCKDNWHRGECKPKPKKLSSVAQVMKWIGEPVPIMIGRKVGGYPEGKYLKKGDL